MSTSEGTTEQMGTAEQVVQKRSDGVAKATGIMMTSSFLSRILGFIRDQSMTTQFGRSNVTDAYIAAFSIPDLLYNLLVGGALSSAFIPVFSGYLAQEKEDEGWEVASTVINIAIIGLTVGMIFAEYFTPYLIPLIARDFHGEKLALTIRLTRIMLPAVVFTGLNGLMMGILNSYRDFIYPAIGSLLYNLGIVAMGILLGPHVGIAGYSIGVIVGVIGNFLIQFPSLKRMRKLKYKPVLKFKHPGVKKIGLLMLPVLIGLSVGQINLLVNQNLASGLSGGSITALRMANRIMQVPTGVFGFSISMAIFPTLTAYVATQRMDEYKKTLSRGLKSVLFITIPATVGLMLLGVPVIRMLFQQGKFHYDDTLATASVLFYYSIGLFAQSAVFVVTRGFYAIHDTKTPLKWGLLTIIGNYVLNHLLVQYMAARGLALAFSLTGIMDVCALSFLLRRKVGPLGIKDILKFSVKILAAAAVMGAGALLMVHYFEQYIPVQRKIAQLAEILLVGSTSAAIYFGLSKMLKIEEVDTVINMIFRRFRRKGAAVN